MLEINSGLNINILNNENKLETKKASQPSFTGHTIVQGNDGKKYYEFYLPPMAKTANLQLVKLKKDDKGVFHYEGDVKGFEYKKPENGEGQRSWKVAVSDDIEYLGYKFVFPKGSKNAEWKDYGLKVWADGYEYNLATNPSRPAYSAPRQMYHLLPDTFNPPQEKYNGQEIRADHFIKLDGTLDSIDKKLDYIEDLGVKRIIATPIFGQDQISTHGYWTTNPYQITEQLGSINDFKQLQLDLFKRGMGWVADGAFVNEGVEGIHIADIIQHGEKSPFYNWFKLEGFEDEGVRVGMLPKDVVGKAKDYFDVKIINSPVVYAFNSDGTPVKDFGKPKKTGTAEGYYNPQKPTYVQLYDIRRVNQKQRNNDEIIRTYAVKKLDEPNDIKNYKDSVQPVRFRIDPGQVEDKVEELKDLVKETKPTKTGVSVFNEKMLEWKNLKIKKSDRDGTVMLWDGNKDVFKLQFTNPQVVEHISQVGAYWTDETDKTLTRHVARKLADEIGVSKDTQKIIDAVKKLAGKEIPASAKDSETLKSIKNLLANHYDLEMAPASKSVMGGLMSYPLDSIEFPPEVCSVLSSPLIKKLASSKEMIGVSREDLMKSESYKDMPETYRRMDNVYKQAASAIKGIISNNETLKDKFLNGEGELKPEAAQLYRLVASDLMKFVSIYSLSGVISELDKNNELKYDINELRNGAYEKLKITDTELDAPEKTASRVVEVFEKALKNLPDDGKAVAAINNIIESRLNNVDSKLVEVSKLIVDRTESGLEWRIDASKDIADIDAVRNGANFIEKWNQCSDFWKNFNTTVRQYNPKAYTIGEVTDVGDLIKARMAHNLKNIMQDNKGTILPATLQNWASDNGSYKDLIDKLSNFQKAKFISGTGLSDINEDIGSASKRLEKDFVEKAGFTTQTNYNYLFSTPPSFVHGFLDIHPKGYVNFNRGTDLNGFLNGDFFRYIESGFVDNILYSHVSPGNHDKPRALHGFSVDVNGDLAAVTKNAVNETIYLLQGISQDQKQALSKAVSLLAEGKTSKTARYDFEIQKQFSVRPFNQNWEDIVKMAQEEQFFDDVDMKKLEKDAQVKYLQNAFEKYKAMMQILVCLPGNPTIYAGDELGETGAETASKNGYRHNRNRNRFELIDPKSSDYIPEFKNFHDAVQSTFNLRNKKELSPLVNGETVTLGDQGSNLSAIYRYNKDQDVIVLFNTNGFGSGRNDVLRENSQIHDINLGSVAGDLLAEGSTFKAMRLNKYEHKFTTDTELGNQKELEFIVKDGKLCRKDDKDIYTDAPVLIFYRDRKNTDKPQSQPAFSGKQTNPMLAAATMKFSIPAYKNSTNVLTRQNKIMLSV